VFGLGLAVVPVQYSLRAALRAVCAGAGLSKFDPLVRRIGGRQRSGADRRRRRGGRG
jgi:hypothetical protein